MSGSSAHPVCVNACRKLECWWQSQQTSGGLESRVWSASKGRGGTGLVGGRRSGLWKLARLAPHQGKRSWSSQGRWLAHPPGGDDKSVWSQAIGLLGADNARESRCLKRTAPSGRADLAAAGWRTVKCVATQGWRCRQRLSGVVTDRTVRASASCAWTGVQDGLRRSEGREPQAWESTIQRVLVTTSRLQMLARGISSWRSKAPSVPEVAWSSAPWRPTTPTRRVRSEA